MNYETFLYHAVNDIRTRLAEMDRECEICVSEVEKLQNQSYLGVQIRLGKDRTAVSLNLFPYWGQMEKGSSYQTVMDKIIKEILDLQEEIRDLEMHFPDTYEEMRKHLFFQIVSTEENEEVLRGYPHFEIEDMSAVFRVDLGTGMDGTTTVLVTDELMEYYGVTEAQLLEDAVKSAPQIHPAVVKRLDAVLNEMSGGLFPVDESEDSILYFAGTENHYYGASVILYPGFLEETAEKLETDYYLLPSSLHEMILVKDDGSLDPEALAQMVKEINATEVRPEERLRDSVYHYNRKKQQFRKVR